MQVCTVYLQELVFGNQGILLVVSSDGNVVDLTLILRIDKEEEAGVEGGVLEHTAALINLDLPIIVHVGDTASHCEILCDVTV